MKLATISAAALAFASSTLAAPTHPQIQKQIQALEVTIVNVINDIVQTSANLDGDYESGLSQFASLSNKLDGPQPCSVFTPGTPKNKAGAVKALQSSTTNLQELSLALLNPENTVEDSDFHGDICEAQAYYVAINKFVQSQ